MRSHRAAAAALFSLILGGALHASAVCCRNCPVASTQSLNNGLHASETVGGGDNARAACFARKPPTDGSLLSRQITTLHRVACGYSPESHPHKGEETSSKTRDISMSVSRFRFQEVSPCKYVMVLQTGLSDKKLSFLTNSTL